MSPSWPGRPTWYITSVNRFLRNCFADPSGEGRDDFIPCRPLEFSGTTGAGTLERIEDPVGIVHLVQRRWTLGTVSSARSGMPGIALDLPNLSIGPVDVGGEPTGRFTIETSGGHDTVVDFLSPRPRLRIVFYPVVPLLRRRKIPQVCVLPFPARWSVATHEFGSACPASIQAFP